MDTAHTRAACPPQPPGRTDGRDRGRGHQRASAVCCSRRPGGDVMRGNKEGKKKRTRDTHAVESRSPQWFAHFRQIHTHTRKRPRVRAHTHKAESSARRLRSRLHCFDNIWCYLRFLAQLIRISSLATLSGALMQLRGRRKWWWGRADEIFRFWLQIWVTLHFFKLKVHFYFLFQRE